MRVASISASYQSSLTHQEPLGECIVRETNHRRLFVEHVAPVAMKIVLLRIERRENTVKAQNDSTLHTHRNDLCAQFHRVQPYRTV